MNRRFTRLSLLAALAVPALALAHPPKGGPIATTADEALSELKEGNARFVSGKHESPNLTVERVKEVSVGQHPEAIILGCSDSRVPPEVIFDEGIGDLFIVRVAGNIAEPATLGSVEYAAEHLNVPLIVVLGHHKCGAVKATAEAKGAVPGNIGALVKAIQPAVAEAKKHPGKEGLVDDAVHANVALVAANLTAKSPVLAHLVHAGKVRIVTAVYDLDTGAIEWGEPAHGPIAPHEKSGKAAGHAPAEKH